MTFKVANRAEFRHDNLYVVVEDGERVGELFGKSQKLNV